MRLRNSFPAVFAVSLCAIALSTLADSPVGTPKAGGTPLDSYARLTALFTGTWDIMETVTASTTNPTGATHRGQEKWWRLSGGIPLLEEFHVTTGQGEVSDTAAIWWDGQAKQLKGLWCASFNAQGCTPFTVEWAGRDVVMKGEYQAGGKSYRWVEVFAFGNSESFTQTLDIAESGSPLKRTSTIKATLLTRDVTGRW